MNLTVHIPDSIAKELGEGNAEDISRRALEALAIVGYCEEILSLGQVAELLDISVYEADGFLKTHRVGSLLTTEDLNEQRQAIDALLGK